MHQGTPGLEADAFVVGLSTTSGSVIGGIGIGGACLDVAHAVDVAAGTTARTVRVAGSYDSSTLTVGGGVTGAPVLTKQGSGFDAWVAAVQV